MKLKYIFSTLMASALLFSGCEQTNTESFDNIKIDNTFLSIPTEGGSVTLTVTSTEPWQFVVNDIWPKVVSFNKNDEGKYFKPEFDKYGNLINPEEQIRKRKDSWLTADIMKGEAGETKVTFKADPIDGGRELEIGLYAGCSKQYVRVRQGSLLPSLATVKEAQDGADGKLFRLKGVCTEIQNTTYGNWILKDNTGEILIYGTLDAKGEEKNFSSLGIEVGDSLFVEGPKTTYKGTHQLKNVTVLKHVKSLIKVVGAPELVPQEGGKIDVKIAYKGNGVFPSVSEECRTWISYQDMSYKKGTPSKLEPHPADTAIVTFNVAENKAGNRSGTINFASHSGAAASYATYTFVQDGVIMTVPMKKFIEEASVGDDLYRLMGTITKVTVSSKDNSADITLKDVRGKFVDVVKMKASDKGGKIDDLKLEVGKKLQVVGKRGEKDGNPQLVSCYAESVHEAQTFTEVTLDEFLSKPVAKDVFYKLEGVITSFKKDDISEQHNNATFMMMDPISGSEIKVYRMKPADYYKITELGIDAAVTIQVVGERGEYKGKPQMVNPRVYFIRSRK